MNRDHNPTESGGDHDPEKLRQIIGRTLGYVAEAIHTLAPIATEAIAVKTSSEAAALETRARECRMSVEARMAELPAGNTHGLLVPLKTFIQALEDGLGEIAAEGWE